MTLWSFVSVYIFLELMVVVVGIWAYIRTRSLSALLIALAYSFFVLSRFFVFLPPLLAPKLTLTLRLLNYFIEFVAVLLLFRSGNRRRFFSKRKSI